MDPRNALFIVLTASVTCVVIWRREIAQTLQDAIDNFRGGPPTGPHPSPANDAAILRRRRRRANG